MCRFGGARGAPGGRGSTWAGHGKQVWRPGEHLGAGGAHGQGTVNRCGGQGSTWGPGEHVGGAQ